MPGRGIRLQLDQPISFKFRTKCFQKKSELAEKAKMTRQKGFRDLFSTLEEEKQGDLPKTGFLEQGNYYNLHSVPLSYYFAFLPMGETSRS